MKHVFLVSLVLGFSMTVRGAESDYQTDYGASESTGTYSAMDYNDSSAATSNIPESEDEIKAELDDEIQNAAGLRFNPEGDNVELNGADLKSPEMLVLEKKVHDLQVANRELKKKLAQLKGKKAEAAKKIKTLSSKVDIFGEHI